jgi:hypothetical protein
MIRDSGQFGSFDGLDNRREILILFQRLGEGLPTLEADKKRARWLQNLIKSSGNGFAMSMTKIEPCDCVAAYFAFVAITGCLGVDINEAARRLDREVSRL